MRSPHGSSPIGRSGSSTPARSSPSYAPGGTRLDPGRAVFDVDDAAADKLVRNLRPLGFDITVCVSASEAASGADVVTMCTADKAVAEVLKDADVAPGMHINTIGGDCPGKTALDPPILERGPVFVEYTPQTRIEGEIQNVAADFSALRHLRADVAGTDLAHEIDLVAAPDDPKDLFGFANAPAPVA